MSAELFDCKSYTIDGQHIRGFHHSTFSSENETLQLAIKRYTPRPEFQRGGAEGVTIIFCHAVGTVKELYEPMFDEMLNAQLAANCRWYIRSVWIADISTHGESGILNEGRLGIDVCWDDHARDMLHMVNVFRDQMQPPLVGIGHSMGAHNIIQLSLLHPRLFAAVIPVEAIVNRQHAMNFSATHALTNRRDLWASRDEAFEATRKSGLCRGWDERVLRRWRQYGFRDLPTLLYPKASEEVAARAAELKAQPVTLSTTKYHEVHAFTRHAYPPRSLPLSSFVASTSSHIDLTKAEHADMQAPFYRPEAVLTFRQLENLRPPCLYVWGGKSTFVSAKPENRADKLSVTGTAPGGSGGNQLGRVAEVVLENEGHFVPFENPRRVAEEVWSWLVSALGTWQEEHNIETEKSVGVSARESAMVGKDWRFWAETWYSRNRRTTKL